MRKGFAADGVLGKQGLGENAIPTLRDPTPRIAQDQLSAPEVPRHARSAGLRCTRRSRSIHQINGDTTLLTNVLQPTHLLILLIVALLLLGPKRLPEAGRALGKGLKEFRSAISGEHSDDQIAQAPPAAHQEAPALPDSPVMTTPTAELTAASSTPSSPNQHPRDSRE